MYNQKKFYQVQTEKKTIHKEGKVKLVRKSISLIDPNKPIVIDVTNKTLSTIDFSHKKKVDKNIVSYTHNKTITVSEALKLTFLTRSQIYYKIHKGVIQSSLNSSKHHEIQYSSILPFLKENDSR